MVAFVEGTRTVTLLLSVAAAATLSVGASVVVPLVRDSGSAGLGYPPLPSDARPSRLQAPVAVVSSGPHVFDNVLPGGVAATYDPCRAVHYVVNPASMPAGAQALIGDAVAAVSAATGLVFIDDGPTDEPLQQDRELVQVQRYGNRWAPVLIGWSDQAAYPALAGDVAGVGGSALVQPRGQASARLVTGQVALDVDALVPLMQRGHSDQVRAIVMHELGHVVGLDHVDDPTQLMYPRNLGLTAFSRGDLEGLAQLGHGVCHTDT